ncbi:MAG TPA: protein kinase [Burkholderiaceae bacterium]|nr:protein kinase [Burkholderiaceae bacterium]
MAAASLPSASLGAPPADGPHPEVLAAGARLGEFEVLRVLGTGGFGIVYLAWDHALEREVALKEYMPLMLAGRGSEQRVMIRSRANEETFALGLRSFVNEARLLARFDHPSLVKVYRFWEDNGTAYMAMPFYRGRNLRQVREALPPGSPGETWVRALIMPLLGALEVLHREEVYHRDIAPDNILIGDDGRPVLLDFGAARRVIGDRTQALTAILKPHFAPIEQYAEVTALRQGPWTDIYGLGSTVYFLLTGQPPVPAAARALHDELVPLTQLQPAGCSPAFLEAIDWAMTVRPQERPRTVAQWRRAIDGDGVPERESGQQIPPSGSGTEGRAGEAATRAITSFKTAQDAPSAHAFDPTMHVPPPASVTTHSPPAATAASVPSLRRRIGALSALGIASATLIAFWLAWRSFPQHPASRSSQVQAAHRVTDAVPATVRVSDARNGIAARASEPGSGAQEVMQSPPPVATATITPEVGAAGNNEAWTSEPTAEAPAEQVARPAANPPPSPAAGVAEPRARNASRSRTTPETRHSAVAARVPGPAERCSDHVFLGRLICMKRACDTDRRLLHHPECVRMQQAEQERRQRIEQH